MPTHRQTTTTQPATTRDKGSSDTAAMKEQYQSSPVQNGYDAAAVKALFESFVIGPFVNDGGHTFGVFARQYQNAPNLAEVKTGGGGLPGAVGGPNPASPSTPGSINPSDIPDVKIQQYAGSPFPGNGGTRQGGFPSDTSKKIAGTTLDNLQFGKSSGDDS